MPRHAIVKVSASARNLNAVVLTFVTISTFRLKCLCRLSNAIWIYYVHLLDSSNSSLSQTHTHHSLESAILVSLFISFLFISFVYHFVSFVINGDRNQFQSRNWTRITLSLSLRLFRSFVSLFDVAEIEKEEQKRNQIKWEIILCDKERREWNRNSFAGIVLDRWTLGDGRGCDKNSQIETEIEIERQKQMEMNKQNSRRFISIREQSLIVLRRRETVKVARMKNENKNLKIKSYWCHITHHVAHVAILVCGRWGNADETSEREAGCLCEMRRERVREKCRDVWQTHFNNHHFSTKVWIRSRRVHCHVLNSISISKHGEYCFITERSIP